MTATVTLAPRFGAKFQAMSAHMPPSVLCEVPLVLVVRVVWSVQYRRYVTEVCLGDQRTAAIGCDLLLERRSVRNRDAVEADRPWFLMVCAPRAE
jgi:hypothetical protein